MPAGRVGIFGESSGSVAQGAPAGAAAFTGVVDFAVAADFAVAGDFAVEVCAVAAVVRAASRAIEESFSVIVIPV